jgi:hypothetical protein
VKLSEGGWSFPDIKGPEAPEEYPVRIEHNSEIELRQVDEKTIEFVYWESGIVAATVVAEKAHDAQGAEVPTTLTLTGPETVTFTVHYRAGNPAAGGAPFTYPIVGGSGWAGGYQTFLVPTLREPTPPAPEPVTVTSAPACKVPALTGLSLHAAKSRLRADHCALGKLRLAPGATAGKGEVAKQFRPAGASEPAGAAVAVKLVAR